VEKKFATKHALKKNCAKTLGWHAENRESERGKKEKKIETGQWKN